MFNITKDDIVGTTNKLLYCIWQELMAINESATAEQIRTDLDRLKRNELMALVKALPIKPESWSKLSNKELINLLKEGT